jgi:large subunit ribosomal protein L21
MYAVIEYKGHQHIAKAGDTLVVDLVDQEVGSEVILDKILLAFDPESDKVLLGKPHLKATVVAEVVKHQQADKIRVIKFKRKNRYTRTIGFRAKQTVLSIKKVQIDG